MTTYPNQRVIVIHRAKKNERNFIQLDKDVCAMALSQLNYSEFKLWIYLCGNMDNYHLAFSPADIGAKTSLSRSSYYNAFSSLLDKGYLVLAQGNLYHFYERPVQKLDQVQDLDNTVQNLDQNLDDTVQNLDDSVQNLDDVLSKF